MKNNPYKQGVEKCAPAPINRSKAPRPFSPLACGAWLRLLVAAALSLVLWLVVFWAMRP